MPKGSKLATTNKNCSVIFKSLKLCSALKFGVIEYEFAFVLAGIGLNVDNEKPTTCLNAFLKELSDVDYKFAREDILAIFFSKFEKFFDIFIDQGIIITVM